MAIHLHYCLTGTGWAECVISDGRNSAQMVHSYLFDGLGDLCRAVLEVAHGKPESTASFEEEPGEFRWYFNCTGTGKLRVRILLLPDFGLPESEGILVFDAWCALHTFVITLLEMLEKLLLEYGEEGYLEKWCEHPFPRWSYEQLEQVLKRL